MFVNLGAIYEISLLINTDCQIASVSFESELALPTSRLDDPRLSMLGCGYRVLFWWRFSRLILTSYRERDEGKQNENRSHVILHGKRVFLYVFNQRK